MKRAYPFFLHGLFDDKGDVQVTFPDFPGCVTSGRTMEEVWRNAREALEFHVEGMVIENLDVPEPSTGAKLARAMAECEDAAPAFVEVDVPEGTAKRINISVPEGALKKIDSFARKRREKRSSLLVRSTLEYISHHD